MKEVMFVHDTKLSIFYFGQSHPMKPYRGELTYSLLSSYNLHKEMDVIQSVEATKKDLLKFHTTEYIDFLSNVSVAKIDHFHPQLTQFNTIEDCPIFSGINDYCRIVAGSSITASTAVNQGKYHTVINWGGGFHHAKASEASGFCYVNDIVLGILELLKIHQRVLYIDIDLHHGDGVEEAFYITDRVLTLSFHKFGDFFPGTGAIEDIGLDKGKYYSVNVPLKDGMDDHSYERIFVPVLTKIMDIYKPEAIFMQCGADCLSGDKLGCFNLTAVGHGRCVEFTKSFNIPLIVVGGGGYTVENVAKAWTYDTSKILGKNLDKDIPYNEYFHYYAPNYKLVIPELNISNLNTPEYLDSIYETISENLRYVSTAPSIAMSITPKCFEFEISDDVSTTSSDNDNAIDFKTFRIAQDGNIIE